MASRTIIPREPLGSGEIPPLETGDHLTRDEFERRYEATPGIKKAELIEGVVHIDFAPVRWDDHGVPQANVVGWLGVYRAATPGVSVGDKASIRLDVINELQPDVAMILKPTCGGQARFSEDGILEGAPELAAEVAGTSKSIDMNAKLRDRVIDWFALRQGEFVPLPNVDGVIRSEVFPGLWLDPQALINDDPAMALRILQQGIDSPEHAAFLTRLKSAAQSSLR